MVRSWTVKLSMTKKLSLLTGTVIQTEKGFFYIKNAGRVRIPTKKVLSSWNFERVVKTTEEQVAHYPVTGTLNFREGSLLYCIADANYYIVANRELVKVEDPQTLIDHGMNRFGLGAIWISKKERDLHKVAGA